MCHTKVVNQWADYVTFAFDHLCYKFGIFEVNFWNNRVWGMECVLGVVWKGCNYILFWTNYVTLKLDLHVACDHDLALWIFGFYFHTWKTLHILLEWMDVFCLSYVTWGMVVWLAHSHLHTVTCPIHPIYRIESPNRSISEIPKWHCSISYNVPYRTEMCSGRRFIGEYGIGTLSNLWIWFAQNCTVLGTASKTLRSSSA